MAITLKRRKWPFLFNIKHILAPFVQDSLGKGTENSKLPLQIRESRSEIAQIISKYIQLQEVSNEHSMEAHRIKKRKASSHSDCFLSPCFSNKGNRKWSFLTTRDHHKIYFIAVSQNELQRIQSEIKTLYPTFTSSLPNSLFQSLDNRAWMQRKQAEGFALLRCSTYVTSGLKSSNPTNAQKHKSENIICFTLKMYCQRGNHVSSAFSSSLSFVL